MTKVVDTNKYPDIGKFIVKCRESKDPEKFWALREMVLLMDPITAADSGHVCRSDREKLALRMMRDEIEEDGRR